MPGRGAGAGKLGWGLAAVGLLAGCAQVGPVLPPSAQLPRPVEDFRAVRRGPEVELLWTAPTRTSDGVALRGPVRYNLCVWPGSQAGVPAPAPPPATSQAVTPVLPQVPSPPPRPRGVAATPSGAVMPSCPRLLSLPDHSIRVAELGGGTLATLALYAVNASGAGAGWSNLARVPLTAVAPPPRLLTATPTAQGVELRWRPPEGGPANSVLLYRQSGTQPPDLLAELDPGASSYLDRSAAWGTPYSYWLRSAAGAGAATAESADSNQLQITPLDIFPPPVPQGLQAVADVSGVELSWQPVAAPGLAGYNLYRKDSFSATWIKRNTAVLATPVFHDPLPASAGTRFAVTAVGLNGRESAMSASAMAAGGGGGADLPAHRTQVSVRHLAVLLQFVVGDQNGNLAQRPLGF